MKKSLTRTTTALGVAALVAVPTTLLAAAPAHADQEKHGTCAGAPFELSVDREGRGFEVSFDLDNAKPGSKWKVVLRHNGKRIAQGVHTADYEGDVEVERYRKDAAGKDVFKVRLKNLGSGQVCKARINAR